MAEIAALYRQHNPGWTGEEPGWSALLANYAGREAGLLAAVRRKYAGPAPAAQPGSGPAPAIKTMTRGLMAVALPACGAAHCR